jgi:hypothetical protein
MAGFGHFSEPPLIHFSIMKIGVCSVRKLKFRWIFFGPNIGLTCLVNTAEFNNISRPKIANSR